MKSKLLALLLVVSFSMYAQSDPLRDRLNAVFANINKTEIQTGFLKEFGAPLVPLGAFRGQLTDSNRVTIAVWRHAYSTIQSSRILGTNPLATLSTVNTAITQAESSSNGAIPIPVIFSAYNTIRLDALNLNLLYAQNNQLFDVANRTTSPYLTKHLFAAAPSIGYAYTGSPSFVFKQELFFNTSNKVVSSISVDFNDGQGYMTASWNTPLAANYTSKGTKEIKIKVIFTDNSVYQCYTFVDIRETSSSQQRYEGLPLAVPFYPNALHDGGWAYVKHSLQNTTNPKKLRRPFIVVEGFDMSLVAPSLQNDPFGYFDFIGMLNSIQSQYDLSQKLDEEPGAGYDLIFLDFNNGTDDIRRNAALLKAVIAWVNGNKAGVPGNEENVILGISMGGLVARYVLADMTKNGPSPQTRLLFTLDSPHRGANVPLGFQAMTRSLYGAKVIGNTNVRDLIPAIQQANSLLDEPASQQMLIVRALDGIGGYVMNSFLEGEYRNMVTFPSSGPQPTYKVEAISLGSQCGNQVLPPYEELVRFSAGLNFFVPFLLVSDVGLHTEIIVNALPNTGQSLRISKVRFWFDYTILFAIQVVENLTNDSFYSPSTLLPWDGAPGGTRGVPENVSASIPNISFGLWPFFNGHVGAQIYQGSFSFVPTVSALDVTTLNAGAVSAPYTGGANNTYQPRIANFIAQERVGTSNIYNVAHPVFTGRNAEWMFREMESPSTNNKNCSTECLTDYGPAITTPSFLCFNSPQNAYLNGTFPGTPTITWSASPASYFTTSSGTGRTAALNIINSSFSGPIEIGYHVSGVVCQPSLSIGTGIWVGPPSGQINGPTEVYPDQVYTYAAGPNGNPFGFQWVIDGSGWNFGWSDTQPTVQVYWSGQGTEGTVNLLSTNGCGTTSSSLPVAITIEGGCNPCQIVTPYPNPSTDELIVSIEDLSEKKEFHAPYEVALYDISGMTVFKGSTEKQKIKINTESLKSGLYVLRVTSAEGMSVSKHVQVVH